MVDRLALPVGVKTVIGFVLGSVRLRSSTRRSDESILEEVVEDDDEVPEELIYGLLTDRLAGGPRRIASIAEQEKSILLVQSPSLA